jgi:hypothetical protein
MPALGLCLALAATAAPPVFVPAPQFTLAWTHSIEKVRWEEDYAVLATAPRLRAVAARVRGSAAGMEPPPDAHLENGWYHYTPAPAVATPMRLTRSEFTADYELCLAQHCQLLAHWLPSDGGVTLLWPCTGPAEGQRLSTD